MQETSAFSDAATSDEASSDVVNSEAASGGGLAEVKPNLGLACVLGLCAALATWGVLQWRYPVFTVSEEYSIGMGAPNSARDALAAEQARVNRLNSAIFLGLGGGFLAALMSVGAVGCCSLPMRMVSSGLGGLVWGGGVGFIGPAVFSWLMPKDALPSPTSVGLAQSIVFALLGAAMGLIYALQMRDRSTLWLTVGSCGLAGAAGGIAFPIILGLVLPSASAVEFISDGAMVRLLWLALPMVAIAAGVTLRK